MNSPILALPAQMFIVARHLSDEPPGLAGPPEGPGRGVDRSRPRADGHVRPPPLQLYEEVARLLTHVDREKTHAASLIVNVAQGNVAEPWPVEVHDHADKLHQVTMDPGDIVYYESAKCLHARNTPLRGTGAHYVNLFTHYRPTGDEGWYDKDNAADTPEPLLDVGECRLVGSIDQVGVGAVECDDASIGPFLSPTMFEASSGDDLIDWWRSVGPKQPTDEEETAASDDRDEF